MMNSLVVRGFELKLLKNQNHASSIKQSLKKLIIDQNPNFNELKKEIKNKPLSIYLILKQNYNFRENDFNYNNFEKLLLEVLSDEKITSTQKGLGLITSKNKIYFDPTYTTTFSNEDEGFEILFEVVNTEYQEKGICEDCENPLNDCICGYNILLDIPGFIQRRSQHIFNKKRCKITEFQQLSFLITDILYNMPNVYYTRSGHEIEDHYFGDYSDHDASRFIGTSIMHELNELLVNMTVGSYDSSIRGIRNLFEWVIRTTVGISNIGSITGHDEDKNLVSCFHTIKESYRLSEKKRMMDPKVRKSFEKDIKNDSSLTERDKRMWLSNIGFGVTKFIYNCDSNLLKYIGPSHLNMSPKKILDYTYDHLSQYTHKSSELLEEMEQNHGKIFFDSDEFDDTFRLCYVTLDYIFYFYLMLLDLDVYHGDLKWKSRWRKNIHKQFQNMILSKENMISTRLLLNSEEWNSAPPKEFVSFKP